MFCERCGKEGADVRIIKMIGEKKHEEHLCHECAKEFLPGSAEMSNMLKMTFSIGGIMQMDNFINELLFPQGLPENSEAQAGDEFLCPSCGAVIKKSSLIKKEKHDDRAKEPVKVSAVSESDELRAEMTVAIKEENYERAAAIRDRLAEIAKEKKIESGLL